MLFYRPRTAFVKPSSYSFRPVRPCFRHNTHVSRHCFPYSSRARSSSFSAAASTCRHSSLIKSTESGPRRIPPKP